MYLAAFATALFSNLALAAPAIQDACCCCDLSQNVVACNLSISASDCICPAAVCPAEASTVWRLEEPTPTVTAPLESDDECCCCDPSIPAITCSKTGEAKVCACAAVGCPPGAPTIRLETTPVPEPTPPVPVIEPLPPNLEKCCCCDISQPAISCKIQDKSLGCFCAFVVCPPDAPTVWPESQPEPTASPESLH